MCVNQLISSYWVMEHFKQSCTQNSDRLLRMLVGGENGPKKITTTIEGALVDRRADSDSVPKGNFK